MSLETRLRSTGGQPGGGGGSSSSSGLMGTGNFLVVWSADPLLTVEKVLLAGSSVTLHTDGTGIYVNATTGGGATSSAGLAGTGPFYLLHTSANGTLPLSKLIAAGSSVTTHTDSTSFYINATTSAAAAAESNGLVWLLPQQAKFYSNTSASRIDAGTGSWRLLFSATTMQYGVYQFFLPMDYGSSPVVRLLWGADSTAGAAQTAHWGCSTWGITPGSLLNAYADTFAAANTISIALTNPWTSGLLLSSTINLATVSSFVAGNFVQLRLQLSGGPVFGNSELFAAAFEYTKK